MTVHVIGNLCRDLGLFVRRLPEPGETLVADRRISGFGGKGLNQAVAAARAGAEVVLVAAVGRGEAPTLAKSFADEARLHLRLVEGEAETDLSVLLVRPDGENVIVSACAAARDFDPVAHGALMPLEPGDILLLQGNLSAEATRACLLEGRRRGALTVLNPSPLWAEDERLDLDLDLVVVNAGEARSLTGEADPALAAEALVRGGAAAVVVTCGAEGALLRSARDTCVLPAPRVAARDTAGAGDVFCGVLVGSLARGSALPAAAALAVRAAAIAVTRPGALASCPSEAEIAALRTGHLQEDTA